MPQPTMGGMGGMGGMMTDEERDYWLKNMPAVTQQEREMANAQALSEELYKGVRRDKPRMDWGSQAARALSGIGSGMADQRVQKGGVSLDEAQKVFAQNYPRRRQAQPDVNVPPQQLQSAPGMPEDDPYYR